MVQLNLFFSAAHRADLKVQRALLAALLRGVGGRRTTGPSQQVALLRAAAAAGVQTALDLYSSCKALRCSRRRTRPMVSGTGLTVSHPAARCMICFALPQS